MPAGTGAECTQSAEKNKTHGRVKKQLLFFFHIAVEYSAVRRAEG